MNEDGVAGSRVGWWASLASLLASSGTLVCCALPALLVAIGAGAALSSLVAAVPQLVWLSESKGLVFAVAGVLLLGSAVLQWRGRRAPCPVDPRLRAACLRIRALSSRLLVVSVAIYAVGGLFAFALPLLDL